MTATGARSVLVSGGGAGLGAAIAARFAADGDRVGVLDIDGDAARLVADLLDGEALQASATDPAGVGAALDRFGAPDVTVCAAGIVRFGPLLDLDETSWREVIDTNLTGTFTVARAAARRLADQRRAGSIIVLTSINGIAPGVHAGAYGATKAALGLLVRQMALEWAPLGIRVNAVAPGLIDGGMSAPIYADPAIRAAREGRVPLGRLGTVDDVAGAVHWLASSEAAYITGQELVVDGGVVDSVMTSLPRPASVDGVGDRAGADPPPAGATGEGDGPADRSGGG